MYMYTYAVFFCPIGGLFKDEVFVPRCVTPAAFRSSSVDVKRPSRDVASTGARASFHSPSDSVPSPSSSHEQVAASTLPAAAAAKRLTVAKSDVTLAQSSDALTQAPRIKGYAVLEVRTRCAVESVKRALVRNRTFLEQLLPGEQLAELAAAELLALSSVNQNLYAEAQGEQHNAALDDFLLHKLLSGRHKLQPAALQALTDVFHSCFISEQRLTSSLESAPRGGGQVAGGFICLSREQILAQSAGGGGNLMFLFFNACRNVKKSTLECVRDVLKRYGVPRVVDKDE